MARLGGLFHVFRSIPNAFKKKPRFDNALHEFRCRLPSPTKNSRGQNKGLARESQRVSIDFMPQTFPFVFKASQFLPAAPRDTDAT